jgi:histidinol-phosphate aminotransferase
MSYSRRWFLGSTAFGAAALGGLGCSSSKSATAAAGSGAEGASSAAAAAAAAAGDGVLRLDANESPYGPSPAARAALASTVAIANRYADGVDALTAAIAARHGVTADHVVLYPGSFGLLSLIAADALRGGGRAVIADPSFGWVIADYAAAIGAGVTKVPLDRGFAHDLDALGVAMTSDTKLVYVCNPNNPTGTIVGAPDLRAFCDRHAGRATVVVDEAYADYVDDPAFGSMDAAVAARSPIIVVRTFSKLFGLAGLRVGYALAVPAVAARLRKLRTGGDKAWVPAPGAVAALASLDDAAFVAQVRTDNAAVRGALVAALAARGHVVPASHTNFIWLPTPRAGAIADGLRTRGIRISGKPESAGCRITIGLAAEMQRCTTALEQVLTV